jgi:hypothetical protein
MVVLSGRAGKEASIPPREPMRARFRRARDRRHQMRCRSGGSSRGREVVWHARASAEYRCVCAQTLPGTTRQPEQSRRSAPPSVAIRPFVTCTSPSAMSTGSSELTTVPPVRIMSFLPPERGEAPRRAPPVSPSWAGASGECRQTHGAHPRRQRPWERARPRRRLWRRKAPRAAAPRR